MHILVTGSEGYLGSALCAVLEKKHVIKRFDKVLSDDITDLEQVREAGKGIDLVIHLAAIVGLNEVRKQVEHARRVNVDGTANVCSLGLPVIFAGALDGYPKGVLVTEQTPFFPATPYYQQKLEAEGVVLSSRPDNVSLRFASMYGVSPVMRWGLLVHNFINQASRIGQIELFQPLAVRPLTHIEDAIGAIEFFINRSEGGIYNIVSTNLTKREICNIIQKTSRCRIVEVEGYDLENRNYKASTEKIEALGFVPEPDFENTIKEIVLRWWQ